MVIICESQYGVSCIYEHITPSPLKKEKAYRSLVRSTNTNQLLHFYFSTKICKITYTFLLISSSTQDICFVATILTFYLYLAVFAWMLVEGVHLYFLIVRVFGRNERHRRNYHIFGWGKNFTVLMHEID